MYISPTCTVMSPTLESLSKTPEVTKKVLVKDLYIGLKLAEIFRQVLGNICYIFTTPDDNKNRDTV